MRRFYKLNNVRYQSGKQCYKAAITRRPELEARRLQMAKVLAKLVTLNRPIIYVDETTFNTHCTPLPKSWSLKQKHNKHAIANKRFSTTVYGAIGNCLSEPVFYTATGTNQVNYRAFIAEVRRSLRPSAEKPFLFFDGHRAHTTRDSMTLVKRYFIPFKSVPHSSNFNSIETVWSVAKRNFQKWMLYEQEP